MISKRFALVGTLAAAFAALSLAPADARAGARFAAALPDAFVQKIQTAKPPPLSLRGRRPAASGPVYTIVDDGAPSSSTYALQNPVAFNDTGQIVGVATDAVKGNHYTCEFFDGSRYRNISSSSSITDCNPYAMNDANPASGSIDVAGAVVSTYSYASQTKAFYSTITPGLEAVGTTVFGANDSSYLTGVNAAGAAIGLGYYRPVTGFASTYPAFFLASGTLALQLLQPACTTAAPGCGIVTNVACAFGGCSIAADGSLLLLDVASQTYEILAPSGAVRYPNLGPSANLNGAPIMNDSGQLLYATASTAGNVTTIVTKIYSVATGASTVVPPIAGNSCTEYVPTSFNNVGQVLGYTTNCPRSDGGFFVYDAANGTQDLLEDLPTGSVSVDPVGINDRGQILVQLAQPSAVSHWGILQPSASPNVRERARKRLSKPLPAGRF